MASEEEGPFTGGEGWALFEDQEKETEDFEGDLCILHTINRSRTEMNLFERERVWSSLQKPGLLTWGGGVLVMVVIRLDSLLKQVTETP